MAFLIQSILYSVIGVLLAVGKIYYTNWLFWIIILCILGSNICEKYKKY